MMDAGCWMMQESDVKQCTHLIMVMYKGNSVE